MKHFIVGYPLSSCRHALHHITSCPSEMCIIFEEIGMCQHMGNNKFILNQTICIKNNADRKSTRLNSSHVSSSYAVFCVRKNKQWMSETFFQLPRKCQW